MSSHNKDVIKIIDKAIQDLDVALCFSPDKLQRAVLRVKKNLKIGIPLNRVMRFLNSMLRECRKYKEKLSAKQSGEPK